MEDLPSGTVTLLFTDVEGSTRLVLELGAAYQYALDGHRQILRDAVASHAGREVDCRADDFLACFPRASDGLAAAIAEQLALTSEDSQLRVRMGLHTGEPELIGNAYIGIDVNRAARICSAGHGGQILVSQTTRDLASTASSSAISAPTCSRGSSRLSGSSRCAPRAAHLVAAAWPSTKPVPRCVAGGACGRARAGLVAARRDRVAARKLVEPGPLREALTGLAAALFDADRAVHRAEALLGKIDRHRIARRLAEQRELSLVSPPVAELAAGTDAKLACLDRLGDDAQVVSDLGAEAAALLDRSFSAHAVEQICERLKLATGTLDGQITVTARAHDALSYRLARTRWRGVYRLDALYVVPYHDELGIERQREFRDAGEARRFREGVKLARQARNRGLGFDLPWDGSGGS
jgi:hypothetical protein